MFVRGVCAGVLVVLCSLFCFKLGDIDIDCLSV